MKRVGLQASEGLELTGMGGLVLVGAMLKRFTNFQVNFNCAFTKGPGGIPFGDVLIPGLAMLCTGKSDFEAVSQLRGSSWAARALQVERIASPETLRQNLDLLGEKAFPTSLAIIETAILDMLRNTNTRPSALWTGHVALDIDTTPQDNSKTHKEKVGRTYKGFDGFCPIMAYAGLEGFLIGSQFRAGTQHSQKGSPSFIANQIQRLRSLGVDRVLVRLDSGFDAAETLLRIHGEGADFIVAVNPRGESETIWTDQARALPKSAWIRLKGIRNLRIAYLERMEVRKDQDGNEIQVRRVVRVKKRLLVIEPPKPKRRRKSKQVRKEPAGHQKPLIVPWPAFEMGSSWSTRLDLPAWEIARLYEDHGTSEQYHSEMKSELDLERLPSGKFSTNTLVFQMGCLAYNVLRVLGISGKAVFRYRHPTQRKRLRTVIQELILVPARVLHGSNQVKLDLGKAHPGKAAILALHRELIPPLVKVA
jgi:hypothetical protein